jgi:hypothetical protein
MIYAICVTVCAAVLLGMYWHVSVAFDASRKRIRALEADTAWMKAELGHLYAQHNDAVNAKSQLSYRNMELLKRINTERIITADGHLATAMSSLIRFIGANQWILENHKELSEAFDYVIEVADGVRERKDLL